MSDIVRKTLIKSKIQVLKSLRDYINSEIDTYNRMLQEELTPEDGGYTGEQELR